MGFVLDNFKTNGMYQWTDHQEFVKGWGGEWGGGSENPCVFSPKPLKRLILVLKKNMHRAAGNGETAGRCLKIEIFHLQYTTYIDNDLNYMFC